MQPDVHEQVYKAWLDDAFLVAVKYMIKHDASRLHSSEADLQSFASEINVLRACRHTNIVTFFGAWVEVMHVLLF